MKNKLSLLIIGLLCLFLQSCALYNGRVNMDLSSFNKQDYIRKSQYDYPPDYYFVGEKDFSETQIVFIYMEHPDGFYDDEALRFVQERLGSGEIININGKNYIKEVVENQEIKTISLTTGFEEGFLLIGFKGEEAEINELISTLTIKQ